MAHRRCTGRVTRRGGHSWEGKRPQEADHQRFLEEEEALPRGRWPAAVGQETAGRSSRDLAERGSSSRQTTQGVVDHSLDLPGGDRADRGAGLQQAAQLPVGTCLDQREGSRRGEPGATSSYQPLALQQLGAGTWVSAEGVREPR